MVCENQKRSIFYFGCTMLLTINIKFSLLSEAHHHNILTVNYANKSKSIGNLLVQPTFLKTFYWTNYNIILFLCTQSRLLERKLSNGEKEPNCMQGHEWSHLTSLRHCLMLPSHALLLPFSTKLNYGCFFSFFFSKNKVPQKIVWLFYARALMG